MMYFKKLTLVVTPLTIVSLLILGCTHRVALSRPFPDSTQSGDRVIVTLNDSSIVSGDISHLTDEALVINSRGNDETQSTLVWEEIQSIQVVKVHKAKTAGVIAAPIVFAVVIYGFVSFVKSAKVLKKIGDPVVKVVGHVIRFIWP